MIAFSFWFAFSGQITQPIQLVHASTFPPPPSPVKTALITPPPVPPTVTCPTPDLPPPPTPILPMEEEPVRPPPKAATMNLKPLNDHETMDEAYDEVIPCVYDDVDVKYDGMEFTPLPPVRKKPMIQTVPPTACPLGDPLEEPTKPLPSTPSKKPSLISKLKPKAKQTKGSKEEQANSGTWYIPESPYFNLE